MKYNALLSGMLSREPKQISHGFDFRFDFHIAIHALHL